jgi:hypothetical protein
VGLLRRPPAPPRRRAWPWLLAIPLSLPVGLYGLNMASEVRSLVPNLTLLLLLALGWASIDPRPTIAAAVYVTPRLLGYLSTTLLDGAHNLDLWDVVMPLAVAAVVGILLASGATRARRLTRH